MPEAKPSCKISAWKTESDQQQVFQLTPDMDSLIPLVPIVPIQTCHLQCKIIRPHPRNLSELDPNKSTILWKWTFPAQPNQAKIWWNKMKVSFKQSYFYNYFIIETQKSLYELRKSHAAFVNRPMSSQPGNMPRRNINSAIPRQQ
jgi:hypothetical protein